MNRDLRTFTVNLARHVDDVVDEFCIDLGDEDGDRLSVIVYAHGQEEAITEARKAAVDTWGGRWHLRRATGGEALKRRRGVAS